MHLFIHKAIQGGHVVGRVIVDKPRPTGTTPGKPSSDPSSSKEGKTEIYPKGQGEKKSKEKIKKIKKFHQGQITITD